MSKLEMPDLNRRRFLLGGAAVGAGSLLVGCTSNAPQDSGASKDVNSAPTGDNAKPGKHVTIGFSAPAADHGWIGAISKNARTQAGEFKDVTLQGTGGTNDGHAQISAVKTLIDRKVDVLVILPFDGKALTSVA